MFSPLIHIKMAINKKLVVLILVLCFCFCVHGHHPLRTCGFDSIYQFGDSISDTGNLIREWPLAVVGKLPYGQNFFNHTPTGRCSNGLLIIDFIAMAAGLPLTQPYMNHEADFSHGVNFAVAGSTALSSEVLASKGVFVPPSSSLDVQLGWMSSFLNSTCHLDHNGTFCAKKLENALFMVGETGGNDYNNAIFQRKTIDDESRSLVPVVVDAIINGVRKVVSFGAKKVVVPGNFPVGCFPIYKAAFKTNDSTAYDASNCLIQFNEFAKYQNAELKRGIRKMIEEEKPNATIVYADYYNAYRSLLRFSKSHGIDTENVCCVNCGANSSQVCENPDAYVNWDGIHLTQQGYKIMAAWLVRHLVPNLKCH